MRELEGGVFEVELPAILLDLRFRSREPGLGERTLEGTRVPVQPGAPIEILLPSEP